MGSKDIEELEALAESASKSISNYIDMLISIPLVACATVVAAKKAAKVPMDQREGLMVYSLAKSSLNLRESSPKASEMINDIVNSMEKKHD